MNLKLNYEGFEQNLSKEQRLHDGVQYMFRFDNGYGASVVKHFGSYGSNADLWERAVIKYTGERWHLTYDTDITDDVEGWLTDANVRDLLERIKNLAK